jgi:hypothetical protein
MDRGGGRPAPTTKGRSTTDTPASLRARIHDPPSHRFSNGLHGYVAKMSEGRVAIADFRSDVLHGGDDATIELLPAMLRSLQSDGYEVVVVVDGDLPLIERSELGELLQDATIEQVPAEADPRVILDLADQSNARVVSNDTFEAYRAQYPRILERRIPYRVFEGEIYLDPEELMGVF